MDGCWDKVKNLVEHALKPLAKIVQEFYQWAKNQLQVAWAA